MSKAKMFWVLFAATMVLVSGYCGPVSAESLATRDSSLFTYGYEMDYLPSDVANIDLDRNGYADFNFIGTAANATCTGGILTLVATSGSASDYFLSDAANSTDLWASINGSNELYTNGYTLEYAVKIVSSTGTRGAFSMAIQPKSGETEAACIDDTNTKWNIGSNNFVAIDSEDNSDDYHVFRIVVTPNASARYLYRDGVLLEYNDSSLLPNSGADKTQNRIFFGDGSGVVGGTTLVDYIRFTEGAYAPVPEPSTLALLSAGLIGLLAYAWRKRK